MRAKWLRTPYPFLLAACGVLGVSGGWCRAQDNAAELRKLVEQQGKQIEELQRQLGALSQHPAPPVDPAARPALDDNAVKGIVKEYLKENPGAGMPPSLQTGYEADKGFVLRSAPNPQFVKWEDESRIPFELRFRGRIQVDYYRYKVTDDRNHLTNQRFVSQDANTSRFPDFSQLEIKRMRLYFEGTAFDPNLRYQIQIDGNTRGIPGLQNNKVIQTAGTADPNASPVSPTGGGVTVDHAVRLFGAWIAYDFHGCAAEKGCGPDCPDGFYKYTPTYTLIAGKMKPFFGIEEYLGHGNEQFVEYSMADLFFSADDDNYLMGAGTQIKAFDDRFYLQAIVTNGNEEQFPNNQMDDLPGLNVGFWYDFGGTWNEQRRRWDLFGDTLSDLYYSCNPIVRVGGAINFAPMDRRSLYGDAEQSRVYTMSAGPGGTRLINLLSGDSATPAGAHAVDKFDSYSYDVFLAGKYRGFSVTNEWWFRNLNNFHSARNGHDQIIYQASTAGGGSANALFPSQHGLLDYGMQLQAGYFVIPKKMELVARWSWISGQSGDINGNGRFTTVTVPGVTGPVRVVDGAFRHFHEADEYTVGLNYFFWGESLKWQTDVGFYRGGNPAGGGASLAGFQTGLDGYLIRTQFVLFF